MRSPHLLIADDEPAIRLGLRDNLLFEGYKVSEASNGIEALQSVANNSFDLIILDIMMPGLSGFDVCKKIRQMGNETPVLFLSAKGEEIDKVLGLELGADDFVTKPFSLRELLARIKAILRRGTPVEHLPSEKVSLGRIAVDFNEYTAEVDGVSIKMSHKEFEVLRYLWEHANRIVSRFELLEKVWGYESQPTTRTVDNFILKLRQKIEEDPNDPHHILTVHGTGYKLIRPVM